MVTVRAFNRADIRPLWRLKHDTIHSVNSQHYSASQVTAWSPNEYNELAWTERVTKIAPFVAEIDKVIVGFADLQADGYIDHFYCHAEYQGAGVGKALMTAIFNKAKKLHITSLYAEVSITAKPFFTHFGFVEQNEQSVDVRGQVIKNFVMRTNSLV